MRPGAPPGVSPHRVEEPTAVANAPNREPEAGLPASTASALLDPYPRLPELGPIVSTS